MIETPLPLHWEAWLREFAPQSVVRRTWVLQGGISAHMTAVLLELPDGRAQKAVFRQPSASELRRNPLAAETEYWTLLALQSVGVLAPLPYALLPSWEGCPAAFAMEFIEGVPEYAPADRVAMAVRMAETLAKIHAVSAESPAIAALPHPADALAYYLEPLPPHTDPALFADVLVGIATEHWESKRKNPSALLHGDYWAGNILWRHGEIVSVIDWEAVLCGDPLWDVAISRLDLLCMFGAEAMERFTHRYLACTNIEPHDLALWDLLSALRLIRMAGADLAGWAAFFVPFGRADITESVLRQSIRAFVQQALRALNAPPEVLGRF